VRRLWVLPLVLSLGCVTVSREEFLRVSRGVRATKGDAPTHCRELGTFEANGGAMGFGYAKDILRYKVGKAGGDLVVLEVASSNGNTAVMTGTGYRCAPAPKAKPTP